MQTTLPQSFCDDNKKGWHARIKVVTEIARRICAIPVEVGGTVADGDDVVVVEAMKMEIPVPSSANGTVISLLVKLDDVIAEGQAIAIVAN